MTDRLLQLIAWLPAALLALGAVAALVPERGGGRAPSRLAWVPATMAILAGAGLLLAVAALLGGGPASHLALPIGLPGASLHLALDPLSAFFLLPVCLATVAAGVWAISEGDRASPLLPVFAAGMLLTLLADDGWTLVLGFELMSLASWALVLSHTDDPESRPAALLYLGIAALGAACLIPAFALLGPTGSSFAVLRAAPPDGLRATAILVLVLVGAGSKAGLAPLHPWLPLAHAAAPAEASAMMSGAMTKVALYVLVRVLFDLCGPAQPLWWCVPLLLMGAAGALLGALRATAESDVKTILACSTIEHIGLIAIGLALAMAARASDLAALAGLAFAAALLHVLVHCCFKTLLFLSAGSVQRAAGSIRLSRLGGLIQRMPVVSGCVLIGALSLAGLPPGAGFASEWLLLQSLLAAPRLGSLGMQALFAGVITLVALALALGAAATVRLVGVALLGRPRSPRAAGATDAGPAARGALIGLAALLAVLGLLPGAGLSLVDPVLRALLGAGLEGRAGLLAISAQDVGGTAAAIPVAAVGGAAGYSALAIGVLLALLVAGIGLVLRRWAISGERRAAAWDGGFAAPPAWLPFGDPATQYGGRSFAQPLARSLGGALLGAEEQVTSVAPGDPSPARYDSSWQDPSLALLFAPIARLRQRASGFVDRLHVLTIRRSLSVVVTTLLLLLGLIAWIDGR
jgi:hydrogenase-4 component B